MIQSIFITSPRTILMERHYILSTPRSVIQNFLLLSTRGRLPSLLTVDNYRLAYLRISDLFYIAVVPKDTNACAPLDFLMAIAGLFEKYGVSESDDIKDNYFILYQVLEETCDGGVPLTTKPAILTKIVPQFSSFQEQIDSLKQTIKASGKNAPKTTSMQSNIQTDLPVEAMTSVNWRAPDISHAFNKSLIMVKEYVMCQANEDGTIKAASLTGRVVSDSQISGMPQCAISFADPSVILDVSLIRNVSLQQWNRDRTLSFIPVDGVQDVCTYKALCRTGRLPVTIQVQQTVKNGQKELQLLARKSVMERDELFGEPRVCNLAVFISLYDYDCVFNQTAHGDTVANFSENVRELRWNVEFDKDNTALLKMKLETRKLGHLPRLPLITGIYTIENYSLSGLSVYDIQFSNQQGKIQKAWQSDVEQVSIEVRQ